MERKTYRHDIDPKSWNWMHSIPLKKSRFHFPVNPHSDKGLIGEGVHGRVFQVCDDHKACQYAAKFMDAAEGGPHLATKLKHCLTPLEAATLEAALVKIMSDHKLGPHFEEFACDKKHCWLTTDKYQGNIERSRLEYDEPDLDDIRKMVKAMHALHIIHRDLKPANILYKKDSKSKKIKYAIADMGSAFFSSDKNLMDADMYTDEEMPPEVPVTFHRNDKECYDWQ